MHSKTEGVILNIGSMYGLVAQTTAYMKEFPSQPS